MFIPAILILAGQKTYGRNKHNVPIYKCIPDDLELGPMLVPYKLKTMGFSKVFVNLYVVVTRKDEKHGVLANVVGPVDSLDAFYEYQIICKKLNVSLNQLTRTINQKKINQHLTFTKDWKTQYGIQDCTSTMVYTIDPSGCADFDDAFSIKHDASQCILTVYIANVPVILDTYSLWQSLSDRVATIYLPGGVKRPMLPPILSEGLCSLKAGQDRVAFAMEFSLSASSSNLIYVRHFNCIVNVNRNFVYEEPDLLQNPSYQLLQQNCKEIKDSHDMVAHMMLAMNAQSGKLLMDKHCGIFRTVTKDTDAVTKDKDTDAVTKDTDAVAKFISNWKCMHGQYTAYNADTATQYHHAALNLDAYAHITSPIRRLVDTINMSLLSLPLINVGLYETWLDRMDHLNKQMKAVQKVQNTCMLLEKVTNCPELLKQHFTGHVFDSDSSSSSQVMVYIPELNITSKFTAAKDMTATVKGQGQFKVFLFSDEFNIPKKIRIMQI